MTATKDTIALLTSCITRLKGDIRLENVMAANVIVDVAEELPHDEQLALAVTYCRTAVANLNYAGVSEANRRLYAARTARLCIPALRKYIATVRKALKAK